MLTVGIQTWRWSMYPCSNFIAGSDWHIVITTGSLKWNIALVFIFHQTPIWIPANPNQPSQLQCCQAIILQTWNNGSTGVESKWFSKETLVCKTGLLRKLQWHTKWTRMFPWHGALKWGWRCQQLINALLTFSVMGNKLGTSNMATCVLRIFSHLFISLDISEKTDL